MARTSLLAALVLAGATTVAAQQPPARPAPTPPPPAPAPGSAGIYKNNAELSAVLKRAIAAISGDTASASIANTDQYRINVVYRPTPGAAIAHPGNTELHYILEGSGTIVTGGTIVRPPAGSSARTTIANGEAHPMTKGDVIVVPAGSAHWYRDVEAPITYLEVRFVAPAQTK